MTGPAHAPLAPSSAPQWAFCSGSVAANAAVPQFDTQESLEGTAAHWVGETVLRVFRGDQSGDGPLLCSQLIGDTAPNGVVIDERMAEGAQVYVDDVLSVCQEHGALRSLLLEHRVHMPQIHADNWGTLDAALHVERQDGSSVLYLWDYKHGHRECSPVENMQLIDYVFGLANERRMHDATIVVLRIAQPFCYTSGGPVNEWRVPLVELYNKYFEFLRGQAAAVDQRPAMTAGKHCRDCAAVGRCATAKRASYSVLTYASEPYAIETMNGAHLATERALLETGLVILKARSKAIDDELHHRITGGATDTGLTLEAKSGNNAWAIPVQQAIALASQFGTDIAKPGVLTPTQATARVDVKMRHGFEQVLKTVTARKANGMKLINATESRTAQAFKKSK